MAKRKAWVITLHSIKQPDDRKIIDVVNARKKIGAIDEHLNQLHLSLFPDRHPGFKPKLTHPSGTQVVFETPTHILSAALGDVDDAIYNDFQEISDWD